MSARRASRPIAGPGELLACHSGVARDRHDSLEVRAVDRATHDALLARSELQIVSPVWWTHHYAAEARRVIDQIYDPPHPDSVDFLIAAREALRDPRALLVTAWAVVRDPRGVTP